MLTYVQLSQHKEKVRVLRTARRVKQGFECHYLTTMPASCSPHGDTWEHTNFAVASIVVCIIKVGIRHKMLYLPPQAASKHHHMRTRVDMDEAKGALMVITSSNSEPLLPA